MGMRIRKRPTRGGLVRDILWVYHHLDHDKPMKAPSPGARAMHSWFHPTKRENETAEQYEARTSSRKELFFKQMLSRVMPRESAIDQLEKVDDEEATGPHLEKLEKFIKEFQSESVPTARLELVDQVLRPVRHNTGGGDAPTAGALPGPAAGNPDKRPGRRGKPDGPRGGA
jgi:hypothetical protein